MMLAVAILFVLNGAIHFVGFAKGFGLVKVTAIHEPVGRALALLWLFAGLAFLASAALLFVGSDLWWLSAAPALIASLVAIVAAWPDAKVGITYVA